MGSVSVLSCKWCMLVSCVHPVADQCIILHDLHFVRARSDHLEEAYSRAGLMTVLYVAMIVS